MHGLLTTVTLLVIVYCNFVHVPCARATSVILALTQGGRLEDVVQALEEVRSTPRLGLLCALAFVGLALLNPLSMSIGKHGGSVLRVFMDVARSALVWLVELAIGLLAGRGGGGGGGYGERWQRSSWVQLAGFVLICVGLRLYTTTAAVAAAPLEKQKQEQQEMEKDAN